MNNTAEIAAKFALKEIAGAVEPAAEAILRKAGAAGLCGIGLPEEYGGSGGGSAEIMNTVRLLTRCGGDAGIAFSLSYHLSVQHFLVCAFADEQQKGQYLRELAGGRITSGLAVSEPGSGAHPKHLKATAEKTGDSYMLNGEKTFLTNGTFLDYFIFIAQTGVENGKKKFTAFLVPANLPSLKKTPLKFGWLKSSPHCSLSVENCSVSDAAIMGRTGMAYEDMVLPFRVIEDVLLLGLILGGLERMFTRFLEAAAIHNTPPDKAGRLFGMLAAMEAVSLRSSQLLDAGGLPARGNRVVESLAFESRNIAREFLSVMKTVTGDLSPDEFETDIGRLIDLGRQVSFIKQEKIGVDLLSKGYEHGLERREI